MRLFRPINPFIYPETFFDELAKLERNMRHVETGFQRLDMRLEQVELGLEILEDPPTARTRR